MTGYRDSADLLKGIGNVRYRDASNTLRTLSAFWVRTGAGLKNYLANQTATASPTFLVGYGNSKSSIQITTSGYATAYPNGGTYAWTADSGWTAISPTSQSTAFRSPLVAAGDDAPMGSAYCTVTIGGTPIDTNTVDLNASNTGI